MIKTEEINYSGAAEILGCSARHVRRIIQRNGITPIVRGHRTVSLPAEKIIRLKFKLMKEAKSRHQHTNGKGRR